ncbi:MAG: hypothetical protein RIS35_3817 [Pseudomonadota bacterium]|jgi:hypothetical protein
MQPPLHTIPGFWMGVALAALMYVNAVRTAVNPVGFATYMGLQVTAPESIPWVRVYGLRALFIALTATHFLSRSDPASLKWLAIFAIPLALGDAWLVKVSGGRTAPRHLGIAALSAGAAVAMAHWQSVIGDP